MHGKTFKATLKTEIVYSNFIGKKFKILKGEEIEVMILRVTMPYFDSNGILGVNKTDSFIGIKAGHRFDIDQSEFKAVD